MVKVIDIDTYAVQDFNRQLGQAQMKLLEVCRTIDGCRDVSDWNDDNRKEFDSLLDEAKDIVYKSLKVMEDTICELREICDKADNIRF